MNRSVAIVIVNWNQQALTEECFNSLQKVKYLNFKVILVDNGSIDGSIEYLMKKFPKNHYILSKKNLGFSGGNNLGIKYALDEGFEYVYLLNNDTEVDPLFLNEIVLELEKDKNIGVAGSTVFYYKPSDIIWYAGGHANWISGDMVDPRIGNKLDLNKHSTEDVDEVAGAGMIIRSKALKEVGLLDERFFIYFEETDLCQRIIKKGYRVIWAPKSKVWHKVSMAFGEHSPVMIYLMTRNRFLFMKKHSSKFVLFILHYFLRSFKFFIDYSINNKPVLRKALLLGLRDALMNKSGKGELENLRKN
jgi:GT2 family glycosyltransferase